MRNSWLLILPSLCAAAPTVPAGVPTTALEQGNRQMYDLRFADAHQTFHEWERA